MNNRRAFIRAEPQELHKVPQSRQQTFLEFTADFLVKLVHERVQELEDFGPDV